MIRLFFILLSLSVGLAVGAPLKSLAEVRALSVEEAAKGLPVLMEGIVIYLEPDSPNFIFHDGTAGCYVTALPLETDLKRLSVCGGTGR